MAKRFTDTEKWKDEWYCELPNDQKLFWLFLCDNCDHAGIWKVNRRLADFHCGFTSTWEDIKESFSEKIHEFGDRWFIPNFLKWQYPNGLDNNQRAIISVKKKLAEYDLFEVAIKKLGVNFIGNTLEKPKPFTNPLDTVSKELYKGMEGVSKPLANPLDTVSKELDKGMETHCEEFGNSDKGYLTLKDKDKDKDKDTYMDKDKDKDRKGGVGEKQRIRSPDYREQYFHDETAIGAICRATGLPIDEIRELMDSFWNMKLGTVGTHWQDYMDFRKNFWNWVRKKIENGYDRKDDTGTGIGAAYGRLDANQLRELQRQAGISVQEHPSGDGP